MTRHPAESAPCASVLDIGCICWNHSIWYVVTHQVHQGGLDGLLVCSGCAHCVYPP